MTAGAAVRPRRLFSSGGVLLQLERRGLDLAGEFSGQPPVSGVDLGFEPRGKLREQVGDALGMDGGPVVHAALTAAKLLVRSCADAVRDRP
jgi:hypothetical protein